MLEFDDIQHILLTRAPALTADTNFFRFATERRPRLAVGDHGDGAVGRVDAGRR